jgi:hypothetical protein
MSRSYRAPWFVDGYGSKRKKWQKRCANKRVRRTLEVPNGKAYRRITDPWNIVDYRFKWDPYPHYYFSNGEMKVFESTPKWKAIRK